MKQRIQSFGRFLSAMVMPCIAAFIAWGLLTALFIPDGWLPNATLAQIVEPMQRFLLPTLIAYAGGRMVGGDRGGIVGFILCVLGCLVIEPVCETTTAMLAAGVAWLVDHGLLWLTSVLVEPAKVLFLNNAINHGIFTPLGMSQVAETGKSIFFLIESNPGPGLGLLAAYWLAGKGSAKETAPGAMIIEFFGGIHEIYFPYVLMNPITIIGLIAGGCTGVIINSLLGGGLVSAASPGSIIAILGMCAPGSYVAVILSVLASAAVSFGANAFLLRAFGKEGDMEKASQDVKASKAASKGQTVATPAPAGAAVKPAFTVAFACDAGMGSSAMGAAAMTKKLKAAGLDITVPHYAINDLPDSVDYVITHESLVDRAKEKVPNAKIFPVTNFMGGNEYDAIVNSLCEVQNNTNTTPAPAANTAVQAAPSIPKNFTAAFACDAGMGSSAMGAAIMSKKFKSAGLDITVPHYAINDLPETVDVVITHQSLVDRAKAKVPNAKIFPITSFMGGPEYDEIVEEVLGYEAM